MAVLSMALFSVSLATAAGNDAYYQCNKTQLAASPGKCIFETTLFAPSKWQSNGLKPHQVECKLNRYCKLVDDSGNALNPLSSRPWTIGDMLVSSEKEVTKDDQNYVLAFQMVAPLRNKMMFAPDELDINEWNKYTRAFTDCNIKVKFVVDANGTRVTETEEIYGKLKNPGNTDIHSDILQYLEESASDLVCLLTTSCSTRCDEVRTLNKISRGEVSSCWENAYSGIVNLPPSLERLDVPTQMMCSSASGVGVVFLISVLLFV